MQKNWQESNKRTQISEKIEKKKLVNMREIILYMHYIYPYNLVKARFHRQEKN